MFSSHMTVIKLFKLCGPGPCRYHDVLQSCAIGAGGAGMERGNKKKKGDGEVRNQTDVDIHSLWLVVA